MKCCGNCKWSLSYEDIKEINCDENELNSPNMGDCSLGINHKGEYICKNYSSNIDTLTWVIDDDLVNGILYEIVTERNDSFIYTISIIRKNIYNDEVEKIIIPMYLVLDNKELRRRLEALSRMIREDNIFALKNDIKTLKKILI